MENSAYDHMGRPLQQLAAYNPVSNPSINHNPYIHVNQSNHVMSNHSMNSAGDIALKRDRESLYGQYHHLFCLPSPLSVSSNHASTSSPGISNASSLSRASMNSSEPYYRTATATMNAIHAHSYEAAAAAACAWANRKLIVNYFNHHPTLDEHTYTAYS